MSVSDGQIAKADTFNEAFTSKIQDNGLAGKLNLLRPGIDPVFDTQDVINTLIAQVAQLQSDITSATGGYKVIDQTALADNTAIVIEGLKALFVKVSGDTGAVTLPSTPFGVDTSLFKDGQTIRLYGTSDTNHVTINHNDVDHGVFLNGQSCTLKLGMQIELIYDLTNKRFIEVSRTLNA